MLSTFAKLACILVHRRQLNSTRATLQTDLKRHQFASSIREALNDEAFRGVFYFRCKPQDPMDRFLLRIAKTILPGPPGLALSGPIGEGLLILHGTATIVAANSIGRNCTLYQQVTIGHLADPDTHLGTGGPIIGDNVTVFAGAIIIGRLNIGDGAKIGAGAVVTRDVSTGATMVGVPARPI